MRWSANRERCPRYLLLSMVFLVAASGYGAGKVEIDSAVALQRDGMFRYDSAMILRALAILDKPDAGHEYAFHLTRGLCWLRLEVMAHVREDLEGVGRYGMAAVEEFGRAESLTLDTFDIRCHRAMAYQILATRGLWSALAFGPRSAAEIAAMRRTNPGHFQTRYLQALTWLNAPRIGGGDIKKALAALEALARDYPDKYTVRMHLARGYLKAGDAKVARGFARSAAKSNPEDLLARRTLREVEDALGKEH